ncbi:MAG: D-alanyl-D-alanine carboxypeptidase [Nitrospirae bacterium]|nr:D-alanyl-D-alanine carboxypeptidase [Nitrospirota bacterium]
MKKEFPVRRSLFDKTSGRMLLLSLLLAVCSAFSVSSGFAADISSKAAVVMEASTGRILYGKNPNLRLAPASTTKLMTAMVVLDRMNLADTVVISERAAGISPVKAHFRAGERVTVATLLNAALIKSANDAAYALAEGAAGTEEQFVEFMNRKTISLGMQDTRFINATGLPGHGEQHTTAYDLAKMLRHALKYPVIREIINTKANRISTEDGRTIFLKNSNRLLWADDSMLGGKTGYTREAKHCLVCASEQGSETVISSVLGAPSRERLWKESEELLDKGFAILGGREEPVMVFTKSDYSDYKESLHPASYSVKHSDVKEATKKKVHKKAAKKRAKKARVRHPKKHKAKRTTNVKAGSHDGSKG